MQFRKYVLFVVALLALTAGACSSGDDSGAPDAPDDTVADDTVADETAPDETAPDETAPASGGDGIAYEVFSSDEGAGCGVYVSVPSDAFDGSVDARAMLWAGVVDQDFTTCGFSDVVEAGLITVNGLDDYDQPDWSTVEEHAFFSVTGWDALVADCHTEVLTDECAAALEASLSE
ncbi:MAG: hypothetical protein R2707_12220 [Acidimicrobiales bacterium]